MPKLGVNIDHVATIRQARGGIEPDPVWAAMKAELGGADQITVHLREDRRHILDRDLRLLKETVHVKLNLECACVDEMLTIACDTKPERVCLVPEKREEVTTEGGLDVVANFDRVSDSVKRLHDAGIFVSLFIDPVESQIAASKKLNVEAVELHTGSYADAPTDLDQSRELIVLENASQHVLEHQMILHAGHGLNYLNVTDVADIEGMEELNIGHSIISRAVFVGLEDAVSEMKQLCLR
ncbi:pyridoxine 5'-phosphate synthase [Mariniblastus fucicola]|uniref:Pyridoxine 5'-phosphate synthase n=1 Tax=Mariniblastus fucicola TaxID=980251 RepID=A0A5B9PE56_9BACT|nr:pyridoxine 5'-phosphate synthase [Mariniblastus fucicola]QEG23430.1 Pyridoxine 5'-phosphate synthase [Mariniblastus fucicola]